MKITDVKAVYPKWKHLPTGAWQSHFWQIVVRVETDIGVTGFGQGGGGEPAAQVVNRHLNELLVGRSIDSVDDIRSTWDTLYKASLPYGRKGIAIMALSGVDLALWDLLAKAERVPVHELIGGRTKERVRAYASGPNAEMYLDAGFTAHKFSSGYPGSESDYDETVAAAARARELFGADALIMTDCYMAWDYEATLEMARRLREYELYWFEDVLTPDELQDQAKLRPLVKPVSLAGGEHEFTRHGFADIAKAGALDIWQPDTCWCGGITEALRILELARDVGVRVVPHRGGEIWGLHLIVATDCDDLAETHPDRWVPPKDELWLNEPHAKDGYLQPNDAPGFGVTLNEALL